MTQSQIQTIQTDVPIRDKILYAQSWEDPRTLIRALKINDEDDVLTIASGGDNSFALLLENPHTLTAIDRNEAQIALVELKMRAIEKLDYDDFIGFLGVRECNRKKYLYRQLRSSLTERTSTYWDTHQDSILRGIIHCGKFEMYFKYFRRFVLPLMHSQKEVEQLLNIESIEKQQDFYQSTWDNKRWRAFFKIFFGGFFLSKLGRDSSFFQHVAIENIGAELLKRTRRGLAEIPVQDNFFVEFILTGMYHELDKVHPYLKQENFETLRNRLDRLRLIKGNLGDFLNEFAPGTFSKFYLSDIFEYMSEEEQRTTLLKLIRASTKGARIAYYTLFVQRDIPEIFRDQIQSCLKDSQTLFADDRTFFYGGFAVKEIYPT